MASLQEQFDMAVKIVQSLPKDGPLQPSNDTKLKFYSYFKQANVGKCNTDQPWMVDFANRAKWDAWNKLGDMSKEEAMKNYVQEFNELLKGSSLDGADDNLKKMISDFQKAVN